MDRLTPPADTAGGVNRDVVSGSLLLLIGIGYGASALRIPRGGGEPGPGALPIVLALVLAALAVWILTHGLRGSASPPSEGGEGIPPTAGSRGATLALRPWLAAMATLSYVGLLEPLGVAIATPAYVAVLARLFEGDRRMVLGVSVGVTVGLLVFFRLVLGVRLPLGPFA